MSYFLKALGYTLITIGATVALFVAFVPLLVVYIGLMLVQKGETMCAVKKDPGESVPWEASNKPKAPKPLAAMAETPIGRE